MTIQQLVSTWFDSWDKGDYAGIPVSDDFRHTSPYGTIEGKLPYLNLVEANQDKFLGNRIEIHDELYEDNRACVRYTIHNPAFTMEVSEWLYEKNGLIAEIIAYYHVDGDMNEDRKLSRPE